LQGRFPAEIAKSAVDEGEGGERWERQSEGVCVCPGELPPQGKEFLVVSGRRGGFSPPLCGDKSHSMRSVSYNIYTPQQSEDKTCIHHARCLTPEKMIYIQDSLFFAYYVLERQMKTPF